MERLILLKVSLSFRTSTVNSEKNQKIRKKKFRTPTKKEKLT